MKDPKLDKRRQEQREMYQEPVRPKTQAQAEEEYRKARAMANYPNSSPLMAWATRRAAQVGTGELNRMWAMAQSAQQQWR